MNRSQPDAQMSNKPGELDKTSLRAPGISLLIIGFIVTFYGFIQFIPLIGSPDWLGQSYLGILITLIGIGLLMLGFVLLYHGYIGSTSNYIPDDTKPGVKTVAKGISVYNREGTRVSGEVGTDYRTSELPAEVKKVKCNNCGYLDDKEGNYCTQCGSKL